MEKVPEILLYHKILILQAQIPAVGTPTILREDARPTLILGGGAGGGKSSGNSPLSQNSNLASTNPRVGTPTSRSS
ncbi:hypothetical protein JWG45_07690 [Leptospira sp. 201903070]|uniref:Uncharacterized protein n=1 Tax=Leptospira ainlahdjerensis TaxID=2810033 RepID=A0ABS2U9J5_9LEPT|nr:hypothetical protein [Leptospira ainlahdjerensis]MBM9577035.1 hypothetical protein [Leptospira ainlahdjerensis]